MSKGVAGGSLGELIGTQRVLTMSVGCLSGGDLSDGFLSIFDSEFFQLRVSLIFLKTLNSD